MVESDERMSAGARIMRTKRMKMKKQVGGSESIYCREHGLLEVGKQDIRSPNVQGVHGVNESCFLFNESSGF